MLVMGEGNDAREMHKFLPPSSLSSTPSGSRRFRAAVWQAAIDHPSPAGLAAAAASNILLDEDRWALSFPGEGFPTDTQPAQAVIAFTALRQIY